MYSILGVGIAKLFRVTKLCDGIFCRLGCVGIAKLFRVTKPVIYYNIVFKLFKYLA